MAMHGTFYIIRFKEEGLRDKAHKFLKKSGILTQIHYIPFIDILILKNSLENSLYLEPKNILQVA